ncbi:NAD dependent epimerase/dehydratase family protein [Modestobacter sp. DSM 44400]|nr:NAD dependent epimerase/dehydratase family protein [Modestobacter sp. DSM 44400]
MLAEVGQATGLRHVSLRYFNVAGAGVPELADRGASNLVPMVFEQLTRRRAPRIFGDDYDTPDGTCIRDFVHVADIASAHVAAARALGAGELTELTANVGLGQGVSVREMVSVIREVTGTAEDEWADPMVEPHRVGAPRPPRAGRVPRLDASRGPRRRTVGRRPAGGESRAWCDAPAGHGGRRPQRAPALVRLL